MKRLILALVVLLLAGIPLRAQTRTADILVPMNVSNSPGTTLTTGILGTGTDPSGITWSLNPSSGFASMAVAASFCPLLSPIQVRSTQDVYVPGTNYKAWSYDHTYHNSNVGMELHAGHKAVTSFGCVTLGMPNIHTYGLVDYVINYDTGGNYTVMQLNPGGATITGTCTTGYCLDIEYDSSGTQHSAFYDVTPGNTYWYSQHTDFVAGTFSLYVYNYPSATLAFHIAGSGSGLASGNDAYIIVTGNNEATADAGYFSYFQWTGADYTAAPDPFLPGTPLYSNNIINYPRATDWTQAGITGYNTGTLPSSTWTQYGSTLAAGSYTGATITSNMSGCGSNQYYLLGSGTFTITGKIQFPTGGNCVLRGSGAQSTFLVMSGAGAACSHSGTVALACIESSDGTYATQPPANTCTVTAGLAQGSAAITLSNLAGTCTGGIVANQTLLFIDSCNTGYSGVACATGTNTDNSNAFVSSDQYNSSGPTGCCGDTSGTNARPERARVEVHYCTAIASGVCTLDRPIIASVFGSDPQVWIAQPIQNVGLENLSITGTSGTAPTCVMVFNALNWWISGVAMPYCYDYFKQSFQEAHGIVQSNYFYGGGGAAQDTYGLRFSIHSSDLVVNNIFQNVYAPIVNDGPSCGNVFLGNAVFTFGDGTGNINWSYQEHFGGCQDLYEENYGVVRSCDGAHATCDFITDYRNFFTGWASDPANPNTFRTNAFYLASYDRYQNFIGNVLGTPGYHSVYEANSGNGNVFNLGTCGGYCSSPGVPTDALTYSTSLPWGNYDSKTAAVRWCGNSSDTGWGTTCGSTSEVPLSASTYPNSVPALGDTTAGQGALPASFVFTLRPSWWSALIPFPAIGSDVTSGNVIQCGGSLNVSGNYNGVPALATSAKCPGGGTGWAGHVNATPAMTCYLSTMGGPPDGSGSALLFNAGTTTYCPASASNPAPAPALGMFASLDRQLTDDGGIE